MLLQKVFDYIVIPFLFSFYQFIIYEMDYRLSSKQKDFNLVAQWGTWNQNCNQEIKHMAFTILLI